jgi:hypothetical protein
VGHALRYPEDGATLLHWTLMGASMVGAGTRSVSCHIAKYEQ